MRTQAVRRWAGRPWRTTRAWLVLLLAGLPGPLFAAPLLEIKEVLWGFDGQVVPDRFNLLSIRVINPSDEPFDGTLSLEQSYGMERDGAVYAAPCFVAPAGTRWVQFYPYIGSDAEPWQLHWGERGAEVKRLDEPRLGPPATVLLDDPQLPLSLAGGAFKSFPESLFPPDVAGTTGMGALLLDHVPRWEPARREALLDWLRGGGVVHLLQDKDGRPPEFAGELAVLNGSEARRRVGAGWVVRHAAGRRALGSNDLAAAGFAPPALAKAEHPGYLDLAASIQRALTKLVQPKHAWWLINSLAVGYIVLVGPGLFLFSRKGRDYRIVLATLLAGVAVFALLFHVVGRRGQGERSSVHSLSVARGLGGDAYLVTHWSTLFAARGDLYTLTHAAPFNLYAVAAAHEPVNGTVFSGKDGRFQVDIPVFSHRSVLHQARMRGDDLGLAVVAWRGDNLGLAAVARQGGDRLQTLALSVGAGFPAAPLAMWAVRGDRVYALARKGDRLELTSQSVKLGDKCAILSGDTLDFRDLQSGMTSVADNRSDDTQTPETIARRLVLCLMGWAMGVTPACRYPVGSGYAPGDHVQVFVLAPSPRSFDMVGNRLGQETGFTLYQMDVFRPGS